MTKCTIHIEGADADKIALSLMQTLRASGQGLGEISFSPIARNALPAPRPPKLRALSKSSRPGSQMRPTGL